MLSLKIFDTYFLMVHLYLRLDFLLLFRQSARCVLGIAQPSAKRSHFQIQTAQVRSRHPSRCRTWCRLVLRFFLLSKFIKTINKGVDDTTYITINETYASPQKLIRFILKIRWSATRSCSVRHFTYCTTWLINSTHNVKSNFVSQRKIIDNQSSPERVNWDRF